MQATAQTATPTIATRADLDAALTLRRELNNQLEQLSNSAGQLTRERMDASNTNSAEQVTVLTQRITELSARTQRLERQKLELDDRISDAMARGVMNEGQEGVGSIMIPPFPEVPPIPYTFGPPREELVGMAIGGTLGVVFLAVMMWRMGKRSAVKALGRAPAAAPEEVRELRNAVDAIALEVERISEGQRFVTALLSEKAQKEAVALGDGGRRER